MSKCRKDRLDGWTAEEKVRNPLKYKGVRVKFWTILKAPKGFKYGTVLLRKRPERVVFMIELNQGDLEEFSSFIVEKFPDMEYENMPIKIFDKVKL